MKKHFLFTTLCSFALLLVATQTTFASSQSPRVREPAMLVNAEVPGTRLHFEERKQAELKKIDNWIAKYQTLDNDVMPARTEKGVSNKSFARALSVKTSSSKVEELLKLKENLEKQTTFRGLRLEMKSLSDLAAPKAK